MQTIIRIPRKQVFEVICFLRNDNQRKMAAIIKSMNAIIKYGKIIIPIDRNILLLRSAFKLTANVLQLEKVAAKVTAYFRQDKTFLVRQDFQLPENQQFFLGAVGSSCIS